MQPSVPGAPTPRRAKRPNNIHQFVVMCLDRATGKVLWQQVANEEVPHEGHHPDHGYASFSPTTDGQHLYVSFGSRGIFCYDLDGQQIVEARPGGHGDLRQLRRRDLARDPWRFADRQLGPSGRIVPHRARPAHRRNALEGRSRAGHQLGHAAGGRVRRAHASDRQRHETRAQLRPEDGRSDLGMRRPGRGGHSLPRHLRRAGLLHDRLPRQRACTRFRSTRTATSPTPSTIAWHKNQGTPYVPSPLLYGDLLYFTGSNAAILSCLDAKTGEPVIERQRLQGLKNIYASPVGAAERIYIAGRDGVDDGAQARPRVGSAGHEQARRRFRRLAGHRRQATLPARQEESVLHRSEVAFAQRARWHVPPYSCVPTIV